MNGRPISSRKKVQILVALTILAWATQTLLHQWARGQEAPAVSPDAVAAERFVPSTARTAAGASLELKAEATVHGGELKLRQICRWSDADQAFFAPLADLTIARFSGDSPFQSVSLDEIRQTLHDAGVNLGVIRFCGSLSCTVTRSDVKYDEAAALQQWINAREGKTPTVTPLEQPAKALVPAARTPEVAPAPSSAAAPPGAAPAGQTLRDLITSDVSIRLNVPVEQIQMNFNPADDKLLNLAEPQFKFNLEARRVFGLGDVSWNVLIVTDAGTKKVPISATARAWQKQVLLVRPLASHQIIRPEDLIEKRILTDRLPDETLLTMVQCVGQESARDLKPGDVMSAHMVNPTDLVKPGQFITVTLESGSVHIRTVARAKESGSFGQSVKVQNEATDEIYEVILTGPQEGTITPLPSGK